MYSQEKISTPEFYKSFVQLDPDIEKFGGVQKFVILKIRGAFCLVSMPMGHLEIIEEFKKDHGLKDEEVERFGGGLVSVLPADEIRIETNQMSTRIGPPHGMNWEEIKNALQDAVDKKYKVTLSG